jgi:hypothetical protein
VVTAIDFNFLKASTAIRVSMQNVKLGLIDNWLRDDWLVSVVAQL